MLIGLVATPALADPFGIQAFDSQSTANALGDPFTQAGGHPYELVTQFRFNTDPDPVYGVLWPSEPVKDIAVDTPPGAVGNPQVVATCTMDQLAVQPTDVIAGPLCPEASQVGLFVAVQAQCPNPLVCVPQTIGPFPVFAMAPPPGVPARFGINAAAALITLDASVRSDDYGLTVTGANTSEALPLIGGELTLWGTPADAAHDPERSCPGAFNPQQGGPSCAVGVDPKPFLTLPTVCDGPVTWTLHADSWFNPGHIESASFQSHLPPGLSRLDAPGAAPDLLSPDQWGPAQGPTGCDQLHFAPTLTAKPDTLASPGASGWTFDLTIPQDGLENPTGLAEAHLKKAVVKLPDGVRVSPSAANGLGACTPSEIALHTAETPACPDSSKIGSLTIDTPVLDEPLTGSVYLATPHDNPSGSLVAIYLVAKGPGVIVKLPGSVSPDPTTGQLVATFDNNPQLPFSHLHLAFFGGPRASLSNPPRCGTYTTTAVLTSWSGQTVTSDSSFTTSHDGNGEPCPAPRFAPKLSAGTTTADGGVPRAGSSSAFSLTLSRDDDDEEFAAIEHVKAPPGLLARIGDFPLCPPAQVAAGTCAEASRIGSVTTTAGPGPNPVTVKGRVYIGGPYRGAPFSLSIVVPAVAGPFDLGTIIVRAALNVNRQDATLDVVTDPLPTILEGIPLQIRVVNVLIDRAGFMVNPTSCNKKRLGVAVRSTAGTVAMLSSHFQVADCGSLPLRPRLTLAVGAKGHTQSGRSTPFVTTITQHSGEAGLRSVAVTLPRTLNALLPVVTNACTQAEFDADHCGKARAGTAEAFTPLLKHSLKGGVFFVKDSAKPVGSLPNLVVALRGQVDFNLVGKIKIPDSGVLSTQFDTAPDVPLSRFTLHLVAGSHGPLGTTTNLCTARAKRQVAQIAIRGQNGKLVRMTQRLKIRGCPIPKRHQH